MNTMNNNSVSLLQRFLATGVDFLCLLILSVTFWILAENGSGHLFSKTVFMDEFSVAHTLSYGAIFFLSISFLYFLLSTFKGGRTVGKIMCNCSVQKNATRLKLLYREVVCTWLLFIAIPLFGFVCTHSFLWVLLPWGGYIVLLLICWIVCRKTTVDILSGIQVQASVDASERAKIALSLMALLTDFSIVLCSTLLVDSAIQQYCYVETFNLLFIVIFFYISLSGICFRGKTVAQLFFGVHVESDVAQKSATLTFLKYEWCKYALLVLLPYGIIRLHITDSYAIFINMLFFAEAVFVLFVVSGKYSCSTTLFHASKRIVQLSVKKMLLVFICLALFWYGSNALIKHNNNRQHAAATVIWGWHFPYQFSAYTKLKKVQPYADFMQGQKQSPSEYILNLFKTYDIVVLEEAFHGECTQWKMISDIVSDSLFIHNVGNVFTEYGSAMHQAKVDNFLRTTFTSDTLLEQETAVLMDYMSGGFYYFTKNLNKLNAALPDKLKVRNHYTDIIDWDYFSTRPIAVVGGENRDSLMALVTINWYNQQVAEGKRHKCLVVTNSRHSFGYAGGMEKVQRMDYFLRLTNGNQGQYIYEAIPDKTANVIQNTPKNFRSFFLPLPRPIHCGIWDKAFSLNGEKPVGFDLKGSPFGNDFFDAYRQRGAMPKLTYADIYTGVIFNKPYMKLREVFHPFHKYAIEQEAARKGITNERKIKARLGYYNNNAYFEDNMRWATSISIANFIGIFFFLFFMAAAFIVTSFYLLMNIICRSRKKRC